MNFICCFFTVPCNVGLTCSLWWLLNRQQRNRNQHRDFTIATLWEAILAARYPRLVFGSRLCFCLILMCVKLSLVGLFTTNPFMCQLHLTLHLIATQQVESLHLSLIFSFLRSFLFSSLLFLLQLKLTVPDVGRG